ncbi:MAG: ABC transporter ATP-binding protein, partial [Burkholderiales bacterium]|nr:ABC transporter ATP-binding protein [Burkholderiales bacterium]
MTPLLEIRDLRLVIADKPPVPVLRGIDLTVLPGQVAGLVGESGAGKSMVGRVILGLEPENSRVTSGAVRFEGRDLLALSDRERMFVLGRDIALIPQNPMTALNPVARIEPQITDVLRLHRGLDHRAARARALELLESVHMR